MINAIDFFCGAGGASAGLVMSQYAKVVAAINHDPKAIECHEANHPEVEHYNIDVRQVDEKLLAERYPDTQLLWWSAECTHFSIAKGGQSRDADSRMLNEELYRFVEALNPDRVIIENVREFRTWGPLDKNGKPIKERKGEFYFRWIRRIEQMGYHYEDRDLNAADYGARTSRTRLFGVFAKSHIAIKWPRQTHTKNPDQATLLNPTPLQKWEAVGPILDLDYWGDSIFNREEVGKKPLSHKTIARIEYGLNKYFPDPNGIPYVLRPATAADTAKEGQLIKKETAQFLIKYHGKGNNTIPLSSPSSTITTKDRLALCTTSYIVKQWSGTANSQSVKEPHHTITTVPAAELVTPLVMPYNYGNTPEPTDEPLSTIMSKRDKYLVFPFLKTSNSPCQFIEKRYNTKYNTGSLDAPLGSILANPKGSLSTVQFIEKQYSSGGQWSSIDQPLGTITTVPKARLISGLFVDCRIQNVFMRMLTVPELLAAQGFPANYKMPKSKTLAKKFIGNSVPPNITQLLTNAQFGTEKQRTSGVTEYKTAI